MQNKKCEKGSSRSRDTERERKTRRSRREKIQEEIARYAQIRPPPQEVVNCPCCFLLLNQAKPRKAERNDGGKKIRRKKNPQKVASRNIYISAIMEENRGRFELRIVSSSILGSRAHSRHTRPHMNKNRLYAIHVAIAFCTRHACGKRLACHTCSDRGYNRRFEK